MIENYLDILEESLQRKIQVLDKISDYNVKQEQLFRTIHNQPEAVTNPDFDKFDEYVEEKESLIQELTKLDSGFDTLYQRISEQLKQNRAQYAEKIKILQELISRIMEKSVAIQAQEARNKDLVEQYFKNVRAGIKTGRKSSKAAYDYYKNMNRTNVIPPQFMDTKK